MAFDNVSIVLNKIITSFYIFTATKLSDGQTFIGTLIVCWVIFRVATILMSKKGCVKTELSKGMLYLSVVWIYLFTLFPFPFVSFNGFESLPKMHLLPFQSIHYVLSHPHFMTPIFNIVGNILLFVPLGLVLPFVLKVFKLKKAIMMGACISLSVELLQLLQTSRFTEFDDVMLNTLGTFIGCITSLLLLKIAARYKFNPLYMSDMSLKGRND